MKWSIREAHEDDMPNVRELFVEYQAWLNVDLCFQGFQAELDSLPGPYRRPTGVISLGFLEQEPVGCVAVRPITALICEMKRLFVREEARDIGLGLGLARRALRDARKMGYDVMRLDTLARMDRAIRLYEQLGFQRIAPYYNNPLAEAVFMERRLT